MHGDTGRDLGVAIVKLDAARTLLELREALLQRGFGGALHGRFTQTQPRGLPQ